MTLNVILVTQVHVNDMPKIFKVQTAKFWSKNGKLAHITLKPYCMYTILSLLCHCTRWQIFGLNERWSCGIVSLIGSERSVNYCYFQCSGCTSHKTGFTFRTLPCKSFTPLDGRSSKKSVCPSTSFSSVYFFGVVSHNS